VGDLTDYTIPVHGERRAIPHVEIEIRQDLIADPPASAPGPIAWRAAAGGLAPDVSRKPSPA
jgi:Predicted N-formylglutamate amidohydrolase